MEITEKLRDVMKKVEPWQWGAGIIVIILGIRSYLKNKSSSATVPEPFGALASSGGGGAFETSDGGSDTTSTIEPGVSADTVNTALDNQANAFSAAFNNAIGGLQNSIVTQNQVIDKVNANYASLQDKVAQGLITPQANNAVLAPVTSMSGGSSTRSAVSETPASSVNYGNNGSGYSSAVSNAFQSVISSSPAAYIAEVARVESVYNNRTAAGMDTTAQTNYAQNIQASAPVNLGNNGIGYNAAVSNAFESSLKSDSSAKSAEIARTNEVIANRTAAGLDTTAQRNYLNKIS